MRARYRCDTGWHHWCARDLGAVWEVAGCKVCDGVKRREFSGLLSSGDKRVTSLDALMILQAVAGKVDLS